MNHEESYDALIEALTLDIVYSEARTPEFLAFGGSPKYWNYYGSPWVSTSETRKKYPDIEYKNRAGLRHRISGPAYINRTYDLEVWYKEGLIHRDNGPAYIHRGNLIWFHEGKLHNLNGPAVVEGAGPKQYWIDGRRMSAKEYKEQIKSRRRRGLIK